MMAHAATATATSERRLPTSMPSHALKPLLNGAQQATLHTLERFGWELKFIRRPTAPGASPLVVVFNPDAQNFCVLDDEGELDEDTQRYAFRA